MLKRDRKFSVQSLFFFLEKGFMGVLSITFSVRKSLNLAASLYVSIDFRFSITCFLFFLFLYS